jgi:hypothetical protein
MPTRARFTRNPVERGRPIRKPLTHVPETAESTHAAKPSTPAGAAGTVSAAVDEGLKAAERLRTMSADAVRGAVECGVRTAYSVIDDYMRRGYDAASGSQSGSRERGHMSDDRQNYNAWSTAWGPASPLMEQWMNAMRTWTEAWSSMAQGMSPAASRATGSAGSSAAGTASNISIQVSSDRSVEVTPHLFPGADTMTMLTADPLQSCEHADAPALTGIDMRTEPGHVRVKVTIMADQPAGTYSGPVRNAQRVVVGALTVTIAEPAER